MREHRRRSSVHAECPSSRFPCKVRLDKVGRLWLALRLWLDLAQACFSAKAAGHPDIHLLRANRPHHPWGAVWTRLKPSHRPANQHKVIGQVRRPISPLAVLRAIPCSLAHAVPSANHPATAAAPLDQHYPKLRLVVAHIGERSLEGVCEACGLEPNNYVL